MPSNGYKEGVDLWNTWGKVLVPVVLAVFGLAAAWFGISSRVDAIETDHQNINGDIMEIRADVRWMREHWNERN